jgi:hypothetical protein
VVFDGRAGMRRHQQGQRDDPGQVHALRIIENEELPLRREVVQRHGRQRHKSGEVERLRGLNGRPHDPA